MVGGLRSCYAELQRGTAFDQPGYDWACWSCRLPAVDDVFESRARGLGKLRRRLCQAVENFVQKAIVRDSIDADGNIACHIQSRFGCGLRIVLHGRAQDAGDQHLRKDRRPAAASPEVQQRTPQRPHVVQQASTSDQQGTSGRITQFESYLSFDALTKLREGTGHQKSI